jgi:hypothetical protein
MCAATDQRESEFRLPLVGDRVETIEVGGKPSPVCRYGVGIVEAIRWDGVFHSWRVLVRFESRTGGWCGYPILGTDTFPWLVHIIGGGGRPFSDMTPDEIWELYLQRRQENLREC